MRFIKYNFVLPINSNYMKRSSKAVISLLFACLLLGTPTKSLALEPTSAVANDTKERNWTIQNKYLKTRYSLFLLQVLMFLLKVLRLVL